MTGDSSLRAGSAAVLRIREARASLALALTVALASTGTALALSVLGHAAWALLAAGAAAIALAGSLVASRATPRDTGRSSPHVAGDVVDGGPAVVFTSDEIGRLSYLSAAWRGLTGRDPAGDLGWGWTRIVDPADLRALVTALRAARASGRPLEHELRVRGPLDAPTWLLVRANRGPAGRDGTLVGAVADITRRRRAEQEAHARRSYTEALLESMQDGLAVLALDGRVLEANARFCALAGTDRAALVAGTVPFGHWPAARRAEVARMCRRALREGGAEADLELLTGDGGLLPVIVSLSPMRDESGAVLGLVETVKDASGRRAAEAAARAAAVELQVAREQDALRRVASAVAAETEPRRVFAQIAEQARRVLGATSSAVVRFEDRRGGVVVGAAGGADRSGPPLGSRLPLEGAGLAARVSRSARAAGGPARAVEAAGGGVGAAVGPPGHPWGAVIAFGIDEAERGAEAKLVRFAELVDLAVASADARQQLGRAASTDPLTGLPNERSFKERLAAEVERARRHDRELGLVLFDVDDFTRVNDQHGRRVGDRVLRELAQRLRGCLRTGEMLARVGGEEFAWIVTETGGMGAFAAAERARAAVADRPFDGVGRLSISAGVCDLAESPGGGGELFRLADVALYWAKANGRDATFRYSPEVVQILSAEQRAGQLERAQAVSAIRVLARAVDAKHPDTREHSERVADLAVLIAQELGWTGERLASLRGAAMVHDVGKISVPDAILLKSGRLDEHEYERIKRHAAIGAEIVAGILNPEEVAWVRHHHERVDGRGYPDGLAGDEISEGAYVLAVADAWDAMTGSRSYRASLSPGEALAECRSVAGRQFPTRAVDALERLWRRGLIGPHGRVAPDPARALSADDPAGGARRP